MGAAVTETVLVTVAPPVGEVIVTNMPVAVTESEIGITRGELEALGSDIVAVALYVPIFKPAGFTIKSTDVEALEPRDPDVGLNVSHD